MGEEIDVTPRLAAKLKAAGITTLIQAASAPEGLSAGDFDVEDIDELNEIFKKIGVARTLVPIRVAEPPAAEAEGQTKRALPLFEVRVRSFVINGDGSAAILLEAQTRNLMPWMTQGKGEKA